MAIDAYSICPCHQNQKIKFCCGKEIVSDLNQILDKYHQQRELAALDDIERAIRKLGPKNCFLGLKTKILLDRNEIEKAAETNQFVLKADPGNFLGLCHQVMIHFHLEQVEEGIECFQDCLESISGDQIPGSMLSLWKTVVIGLIFKGHLIAARSYLAIGDYLFQGEDRELKLIASRMNEFPDESQLMKRWFRLLPVSPEQQQQDGFKDWGKKYQAIQALVERGQFRRAFKLLKKLDAAFPDQPILVYAIAVTGLLTLQYDSAIEALRRYSRMVEVDLVKAVEAEALAQLLEPHADEDLTGLMRTSFEINDLNSAFERLAANDRFSESKLSDQDDPTSTPRYGFYLLDKNKITAEDRQRNDIDDIIPRIVGVCELFDSQADRPAQLVVEMTRDESFEPALELVRELLQQTIINETSEEVSQVHSMELLLGDSTFTPPGLSLQEYQDFVVRNLMKNFKRQFPEYRTSILDSLTVTEAAKHPELRIPLLALIARLSMTPTNSMLDLPRVLEQVVDELQIPKLPQSELGDRDVWDLSPLERECLNLKSLSDRDLAIYYQLTAENSQVRCLRRSIEELLARTEQTMIPKYNLYENLGLLTFNPTEGLEHLTRARHEARESNQPLGPFFVREFEYRIKRQLFDKLPDLMQTLESNYLDDPQIRMQFSNVLKRNGLLNPSDAIDDANVNQPGNPYNPSLSFPPPDSDLLIASPPDSEPSQPSKLWLPE